MEFIISIIEFFRTLGPLVCFLILISGFSIYLAYDYWKKFKNLTKFISYLIYKAELIDILYDLGNISDVMIRLYRLSENCKRLNKGLAKRARDTDIVSLKKIYLKNYYQKLFALPETVISEVFYRSCSETEFFDLGHGGKLYLSDVLRVDLLPTLSPKENALIYKRVVIEGVGAKKSPQDTIAKEQWSDFARNFIRDFLTGHYDKPTFKIFLDELAKLIDEHPKNKQAELLTLLAEEKFLLSFYLSA